MHRVVEELVLVGVYKTIVCLEGTFVNIKGNCPARVLLMLQSMLSSSVPGGIDSSVWSIISRWSGWKVVSKRAAGLVFFLGVTVWKGVSAPFAATPA